MLLNKKDFLLMYPLIIVSFLLYGIIVQLINNYIIGLLFGAIFISFSGLFYFYRNKCNSKDALFISLLFGFTAMPVYFLVFIFPLGFILGSYFGTNPNYTSILNEISWLNIFIELIIFGIIITILTIISHFIYKIKISK